MAEYSALAIQTVNPGESIVFTEAPFPCRFGLVRHRTDSGNFLLSGSRASNCRRATYLIDFGANIAVPEGETVGAISVAFSLDGSTLQDTTMTVTPAAVNEYFNISRATNVEIFNGCCESLSIRNTSTIPILVSNANIIFERR